MRINGGLIDTGQSRFNYTGGPPFVVSSQEVVTGLNVGLFGGKTPHFYTKPFFNRIHQPDHGFLPKDVVRYEASTGLYVKALADSSDNCEMVGVVESVDGDYFNLILLGPIAIGGLIPGQVYYLSDSVPGALTTTKPTNPDHYQRAVLFAMTATGGYVYPGRGSPIGVTGGGMGGQQGATGLRGVTGLGYIGKDGATGLRGQTGLTGPGLEWVYVSSNTNALRSKGYLIDCSSAPITLTLPPNPSVGSIVGVCDASGTSSTNNITVGRNGQKIYGMSEDLIVDRDRAGFTLAFSGSTYGWVIVTEISSGDPPPKTKLEELDDVSISNPTPGQILSFNGAYWVNSSGGGGGGGSTGPGGFTGLMGVTGLRGSTGPGGFTGLMGVTGLRGSTGPSGISTGGKAIKEKITQASHGFTTGDAIRYTGTEYTKAQANSSINSELVGVVESTSGDDFIVVYEGRIEGLSGLTPGAIYFLSDTTPGLLTETEPTASGSVSKPVMVATSSSSGVVINMRGLVLGDSGVVGQTYVHNQSTPSDTWVVDHGLGTVDLVVQAFGTDLNLISPTNVAISGPNSLTLTFSSAIGGKAVVVAALGASSGLQKGAAHVRLERESDSTISLQGIPGTSKKIEVNGYPVDCTTPKICDKTDNLITSSGGDSGSSMSNQTLYYVYISNHLASYGPSSLRASTTPPTNGYLGVSGNAVNWRYVGLCYLMEDGKFYDDESYAITVSSHFNKVKRIITRNYDDTSHTHDTPVWRPWNSSTSGRIYWLNGLGEDFNPSVVSLRGKIRVSFPTNGGRVWVVVDGTTFVGGVSLGGIGEIEIQPASEFRPTAGIHYQELYEYANEATTITGYGTDSGVAVTIEC